MSRTIAVVAPSSPRPRAGPAVDDVAGGRAQGAVVVASRRGCGSGWRVRRRRRPRAVRRGCGPAEVLARASRTSPTPTSWAAAAPSSPLVEDVSGRSVAAVACAPGGGPVPGRRRFQDARSARACPWRRRSVCGSGAGTGRGRGWSRRTRRARRRGCGRRAGRPCSRARRRRGRRVARRGGRPSASRSKNSSSVAAPATARRTVSRSSSRAVRVPARGARPCGVRRWWGAWRRCRRPALTLAQAVFLLDEAAFGLGAVAVAGGGRGGGRPRGRGWRRCGCGRRRGGRRPSGRLGRRRRGRCRWRRRCGGRCRPTPRRSGCRSSGAARTEQCHTCFSGALVAGRLRRGWSRSGWPGRSRVAFGSRPGSGAKPSQEATRCGSVCSLALPGP